MTSEFIDLQKELDRKGAFLLQLKHGHKLVEGPDFLQYKIEGSDLSAIQTTDQLFSILFENAQYDEATYQEHLLENALHRLRTTMSLMHSQIGFAMMADDDDAEKADNDITADNATFSRAFAEANAARSAMRSASIYERESMDKLSEEFGDITDEYAMMDHLEPDLDTPKSAHLQYIFYSRLDFLNLHLDNLGIKMDRIYVNTYETACMKYAVDMGIAPPSKVLDNQIKSRLDQSTQLLAEVEDGLLQARDFKSELQMMGHDNFSRSPFAATKYNTLPLANLYKNTP